eukprot:CAMPEP_0185831730 /NCGR_PEP_ID=MMETSP1353-20130828/1676_1 /TAXON_ID=1077150 /ORGANISM="Erythrolobus australicus, Strain CCMP3124" /LENGTH=96 /DNA_ID=CAMNT_0028529835 /DNA_START=74 /DNA_END=365 /DNA_ORIENTATION=+
MNVPCDAPARDAHLKSSVPSQNVVLSPNPAKRADPARSVDRQVYLASDRSRLSSSFMCVAFATLSMDEAASYSLAKYVPRSVQLAASYKRVLIGAT